MLIILFSKCDFDGRLQCAELTRCMLSIALMMGESICTNPSSRISMGFKEGTLIVQYRSSMLARLRKSWTERAEDTNITPCLICQECCYSIYRVRSVETARSAEKLSWLGVAERYSLQSSACDSHHLFALSNP